MPVHYASSFGNLDKIYQIAKKYKLRVIEDAAHSLICIRAKKLDIMVTSFVLVSMVLKTLHLVKAGQLLLQITNYLKIKNFKNFRNFCK